MFKSKKVLLSTVVSLLIIFSTMIISYSAMEIAKESKYQENLNIGKKFIVEKRYHEAMQALRRAESIKDGKEVKKYISIINSFNDIRGI